MGFKTKQTVACINSVKVGGQPGENPTCIIPSIFYDGHKIVSNPAKGEFDKKQAETQLNKVQELSEKTGNPYFIDVMGTTAGALTKYVDFVSEQTTAPLLVDSISTEAKLETLMHLQKIGLTDKVIYNSINFLSTPQELQKLNELKVKSAIVLAYDPKDVSGKKEAILSGTGKQPGLLSSAEKAGINNILVDTAVTRIPSIGTASRAIFSIKEKYGLPAGCAPANAIGLWKKLNEGEFGPDARKACLGASILYTQTMAADFVIAGRIDEAEWAFPVCAMADAIIAAETQNLGVQISANHPLYKIF